MTAMRLSVEYHMFLRFNRLAWGTGGTDKQKGVIAAGMENGELNLWDPSKIVASAEYVDCVAVCTWTCFDCIFIC